jgi:predicted  nucleic acid-binding Zn-ribbon protein
MTSNDSFKLHILLGVLCDHMVGEAGKLRGFVRELERIDDAFVTRKGELEGLQSNIAVLQTRRNELNAELKELQAKVNDAVRAEQMEPRR